MDVVHNWVIGVACLLLVVSVPACRGSLYTLPDPPPREDWQRHSLNPAEDEERNERNFRAAQDAVISFSEAMRDQRYSDAYEVLSNETRILLDDLSPSGRGEDVLATGALEREGVEYQVDPVDLFVIHDLVDLVDEQPHEMEAETYRRKEVWAIGADGAVHRVIVIDEGNGWHIHKPQIELTPGAPGRRSFDG